MQEIICIDAARPQSDGRDFSGVRGKKRNDTTALWFGVPPLGGFIGKRRPA